MGDNTLNTGLPGVNRNLAKIKKKLSVSPPAAPPKDQAPTDADRVSLGQSLAVSPAKTPQPALKTAPPTEKVVEDSQPQPQAPVILGPDGNRLPVTVDAEGNLVISNPDLLAQLAEQAKSKTLEEPGFINPLAKIEPKEMGPVGDFLQLEPKTAKETLAARQPEIHKFATLHKQFNDELDHLTKGVDNEGATLDLDVPVEKLRAFEARWTEEVLSPKEQALLQRGPEEKPLKSLEPEDKTLHAGQMTRLMEAYKDRGYFEDVSRFYEKMRSLNPNLAHYEIPRENYIVSLNKQKRIKESIQESEALINERVVEVNHGPMGFLEASRRNVYRSLGVNGEILSGMGKAYKLIHKQAEGQIDERVAGANFSSLYSQLTGTAQEDWTLGGKTLGTIATKNATDQFKSRFETLAERQEKPMQALSDAMSWVEKTTGVERDQWAEPASPALFSKLKETEDVLGAVSELTGRKPSDWTSREKEVQELASGSINKAVGDVVRGRGSLEDINRAAEELSGKPISGPLAEASVGGKLDSLMESVTKRGNLDPELVKRVENNSSSVIGGNLLKASRKSLEVSRDYYLAGFGVDVEYYPGINVVYNELQLGNHKAAKGLIPIVQYAVMREGGQESKDYWNLATQMELGAIGDQAKTVHNLLPRLFDSAKVGWELDTTASNLEELAEKKRQGGEDASLIEFVSSTFRKREKIGFPPPEDFHLGEFVRDAQEALAKTHDITEVPETFTPEEQMRKKATDKIKANSRDFQELFTSKFVGGSWKYVSKGGVSDRPINRQTIRALREVNKHLGFNELESPEEYPVFHSRILRYIDNKFGLVDSETGERPMEDLQSEVHHKRDKFTANRHDAFHSRTSGTAQTNLAVEIMLGQSDCRDTDLTYQVAFDLWKRDQQTAQLQGAIDAVMDGHEQTLEKSLESAKEWDTIQVVSMSLDFLAAAKLKLDDDGNPIKYKIETDKQGRMLRTDDGDLLRDKEGKPVALEGHDMPFVTRYDEKGLILPMEEKGLEAKDPFYRHFWQLGSLNVDPLGILDQEKGLALGQAGVTADDGKPVDLYGVPTRFSGAGAQPVEGEAGQVTLGGLEVAMNDLSPLLSENNEMTHLTEAITGIVTGDAKSRVLNAVMSRMLDEAAADIHKVWKRSKDRQAIDPQSPFLGAAAEKVTITKEAANMEYGEFREWIQKQAPDGFEVPKWKMGALHNAPEGSVVFDPAYKTYSELIDSGEGVRRTGEAAVAPLATALYLQDFRHAEDLNFTLENILSGKDAKGKEELEKVNRVAYLASQMVVGERGIDNQVAIMAKTGETKTTQGRKDFLSWHTLHADDQELAELDTYTLKPAADWMMKHLDSSGGKDGRSALNTIVGQFVEEAAADAHNIGWKVSKDNALADQSNPFVGWAPVRNRISSKTPEVAEMSRQEIADFYSIPMDQLSENKAEAIREATRQAVEEGREKGSDITHTLYKPYSEVAADQADGGTRFSGANAVPLMTLALYLSDFRSGETETMEGLKKTLAGLMTGSDKEGLKDVTMLNHVAFQAAQLPYGERSYDTEVPVLKNSGQRKTVEANASMATYDSEGLGAREENGLKTEASAKWLTREMDSLVENT